MFESGCDFGLSQTARRDMMFNLVEIRGNKKEKEGSHGQEIDRFRVSIQ